MKENQILNQSITDKKSIGNKIQIVLALSAGSLLLGASYVGFAFAETEQSSSGNIQIKVTDAIKNDPGMMKILYNIELFKQRYAAQQQKQEMMDHQKSLIDAQRKIANSYLQADLASSNSLNELSPRNAFGGFVNHVTDNSTKSVFWSQFEYMQEKVTLAKLAMNKVIQSGGTREQALQAYYEAASSQKTELVSVNKNLNIKYHLADGSIQDQFNKFGNLKKYSAS